MAWSKYDSTGAALEGALTDFPVGSVVSWAADSVPSGWLKCDGTAINRVAYPELFGVIGTHYGTGDGSTTFNLPTSDGEIILAFSMTTRLSINTPPQYVNVLPATPVDGTEVYYQSTAAGTGGGTTNSMADVGVAWHLRYRAVSAGPKWEYIGGGALYDFVSAEESVAGTAYVNLTTQGPLVTLPLPGDYYVTLGARGYNNTAGHAGLMTYSVGSTLLDSDGIDMYTLTASSGYIPNHSTSRRRTNMLATPVITKYKVANSGTAYFQRRFLQLTPIRVNAA